MSTDSSQIVRNGELDLDALRRCVARPPLFAPHERPFWNDPHISRWMLAAHLDPNTDAASRRPETIDRTVDWLVSHLHLTRGQSVLDLGCGPGLYCARLARHGLRVTGLDFSPGSIEYAINDARANALSIDYLCQDYLTMDYGPTFDAIFLIYFDFGVLPDSDRDELLRRVYRALKPGGAFVFDVRTANRPAHPDGETRWKIEREGFWRPDAYLELTTYFQYPEANVDLVQTVIVDALGQASVYRIWERYYSVESIAAVLEPHGFRVHDVWSDLTGQPYAIDSKSLGIVARKG